MMRLKPSLSAPGIPVRLILAAFTLLPFSHALAQETNPDWQPIIEQLETLPVQDYGFVRSAYSFAENHLESITGRKTLYDVNPVMATLHLIANPERRRTEPLLKITFPDLVKMFDAKQISLEQYRNPQTQQQLAQRYQQDQQKWLKPLNELETRARNLENLEQEFAILPRQGTWQAPLAANIRSPEDRRIVEAWDMLISAVRTGDPTTGAQAVDQLQTRVAAAQQEVGASAPHLGLDVFYHRHAPFRKAAFFYLLASILFLAGILFGGNKINWAGFALLAIGFVEQGTGIAIRWVLAGRAPLSNMFESFIFAIAGLVLLALIFEAIWRTRLAGLGGGVLGFIFMVLAHNAPIFESQIRPLMPALQSSWLTYHVVTIMLSYSAFALSFFVAIVYLARDYLRNRKALQPVFDRLPSLQTLDVANYKIIAVGFPLLTLGIITGAVWAETAWGRPWGFDPKETWSAITWMIYAIYLHARFLANWQGRRAAYLSLLGFAAVLFTYLGVNYLLTGLHSYV